MMVDGNEDIPLSNEVGDAYNAELESQTITQAVHEEKLGTETLGALEEKNDSSMVESPISGNQAIIVPE